MTETTNKHGVTTFANGVQEQKIDSHLAWDYVWGTKRPLSTGCASGDDVVQFLLLCRQNVHIRQGVTKGYRHTSVVACSRAGRSPRMLSATFMELGNHRVTVFGAVSYRTGTMPPAFDKLRTSSYGRDYEGVATRGFDSHGVLSQMVKFFPDDEDQPWNVSYGYYGMDQQMITSTTNLVRNRDHEGSEEKDGEWAMVWDLRQNDGHLWGRIHVGGPLHGPAITATDVTGTARTFNGKADAQQRFRTAVRWLDGRMRFTDSRWCADCGIALKHPMSLGRETCLPCDGKRWVQANEF